MTRKKAHSKRAYLARDDRRSALLDVAATVVEEHGWPALSMIAVAETAKVSRQLVYQHFSSVDELMADTMSHLFRGRYEMIRSSIKENAGELEDLVRIAERQTFDDRPGRVRALWQMITATYSDSDETGRMSTRLRHLLIKLWAPKLSQQLRLDEPKSRALAWMLSMSYWGAHQLVQEGEITREEVFNLFAWMLSRLQQSPAATAPVRKPGGRRAPAAKARAGKSSPAAG